MSFPCVVADIGGTTLRIGRLESPTSAVAAPRRVLTDGLGRHPGAGAGELQRRVVDQLVDEIGGYLGSPDGTGARAVGLSFAGPMTAGGVAIAAPTIWGGGGEPLRVGEVLECALGVPVVVANDITAAAWRYATTETEPFCLVTVSSGVGCKVFRHGEVLIDDAGYGGEIGHWQADPGPDAPRCDCGGHGHLGAIASGRGVLAATRRAASLYPDRFAGSALSGAGRPDAITNEQVAAAIRQGDRFATGVLRAALRHLAAAIGALFAAIGIRRYLFIGGFATALGGRFIEVLGDELVRAGCFGLDAAATRAMLALGEPDDDHCLIGIGQILATRLAGPITMGRVDAHADSR